MAATGLTIMLIFAALGVATALLVAVHDAVEAWLDRRSYRSLRAVQGGGGEGGLPLPARTAPLRRSQRSRLPAPAVSKPAPITEPVERPAWYHNARRDLAQH